jgi:tetratricopeptide (TPR) repeat protein
VQPQWHDDLTYFSYGVRAVPGAPYMHHGLAVALVERDRMAAALDQLTLAAELDPRDDDIIFDRGVVEAHLGDYTDAVHDMRVAITIRPNRPAKNYASLANYADAAGMPAISEAALAQAEKLDGGARLAELTRAQIALRHGNPGTAESILDGMLAQYPSDVEGWSLLGSARVAANNYPGALVAYRNLARLAPDYSAGYFLSAQVLHALGRDAEAMAQCRLALKVNPNDPATLALIAQINKAKPSAAPPSARGSS